MKLRFYLVPACIGLLLAPGCASLRGSLRRAEPTAAGSPATLRGHTAEIDITPPPGYAMAGHSREGAVALGVWTRLMARVLVFEDATGTPLVLAACDLWAIPAGLTDRVSELVAADPRGRGIGREHLVLAATHTHHGPGNYASARTYNDFTSAASGFDPELFEFLAGRIASAILDARAGLQPVVIRRHVVAVPTVTRNRSLTAFAANSEADGWLQTHADLPGCPEAPREPVPGAAPNDPCHALDPRLTTLEVRPAQSTAGPLAIAGFFASHPTAMPNYAEVYSGDFFAVATARARAQLAAADGPGPQVMLFNGAEADVSPNWREQGLADTVALGNMLGDAIVVSLDAPGEPVAGSIGISVGRAMLANTQVATPRGPQRTAKRALRGYPSAGGSEDGRTRWYRRGRVEGVRLPKERWRGQGLKRPLVPLPLLAFASPKRHFPQSVPVAVVRLGALALVTLPGEFTTMMGHRISASVAAASPRGDDDVVLVGLAGEYASYFTTAEEYTLQHYEGASTLYGPWSGESVKAALTELARQPTIEVRPTYFYRPGRTTALAFGRAFRRKLVDVPRRMRLRLDIAAPDIVAFEFADRPPPWPAPLQAQVWPTVVIEARAGAGGWQPLRAGNALVDERSAAFVTFVRDADPQLWRWQVIWREPAGVDPTTQLRFKVQPLAGPPRCSAVFSLSEVRQGALARGLADEPCEAQDPARPK